MLLLGQGAQFVYRSADQFLTIYQAKSFESEYVENGDIRFELIGGPNPVVVESRLDGLRLSSSELNGLVSKTEEEKPGGGKATRSYFKELKATQNSTLVLDSTALYEAQVEQAKRLGQPAPATPESKDKSTLKTQALTYSGDPLNGTLTLPNEFNIESNASGKVKEVTFTQTTTASGKSGSFTLDPKAKGKVNPIRRGSIAGPVVITINRTEKSPDKPEPELIKISCSADRVELDLVEARTITLTGNVKLDGENGLYSGSSVGMVAVITLDESLKPIKIRITGEPVDSRFKKKDGGR